MIRMAMMVALVTVGAAMAADVEVAPVRQADVVVGGLADVPARGTATDTATTVPATTPASTGCEEFAGTHMLRFFQKSVEAVKEQQKDMALPLGNGGFRIAAY